MTHAVDSALPAETKRADGPASAFEEGDYLDGLFYGGGLVDGHFFMFLSRLSFKKESRQRKLVPGRAKRGPENRLFFSFFRFFFCWVSLYSTQQSFFWG